MMLSQQEIDALYQFLSTSYIDQNKEPVLAELMRRLRNWIFIVEERREALKP